MNANRVAVTAALLLTAACATVPVTVSLNEFGLPPKLAPSPTSAAISEADLKTRLYIFAPKSRMPSRRARRKNASVGDSSANVMP